MTLHASRRARWSPAKAHRRAGPALLRDQQPGRGVTAGGVVGSYELLVGGVAVFDLAETRRWSRRSS